MQIPERIIYIAMLGGGATWLIFLCLIYIDANYRSYASWVEWIGPLFFIVALVVVLAALIISIWALVTGPALARFAALKWFALLIPSIIFLNHLVSLAVPMAFGVALVLFPAKWLRNQVEKTQF